MTAEKISTTIGTHTLGDSDLFGSAVAISGDILAVGAYYDDDGATNAGAVYLLTDADSDGDWTDSGTTVNKLHTTIGTHTLGANDYFGSAVAISGDILAVGAFWDDDGATNAGAVYLLTDADSDGDWTDSGTTVNKLHTTIGTHTLGANDYFGSAVAISGDILAVGAFWDDDGAVNAGAVYLLTDHDQDGDWTDSGTTVNKLHTTIGTHTLGGSDSFGSAVAISGDILAVGAFWDDDGAVNAGAVYLLTDHDQDGDWTDSGTTVNKLHTTIGTHTLGGSDSFGSAVAISGDILAVGAYYDDDGATNAGAVYLLTDHDQDGDWTDSGTTVNKLHTTIGTHTLGGSDSFGSAVAISGDILAVGAYYDDDGATNAGTVYTLDSVRTFSGDIPATAFEKDGVPSSGDGKLADGATVTVTATPTDLAGNVGTAATGSFIYDQTAPTVTGIGASGTTLTATTSEDVWAATAPDTGDFVITRSGGGAPTVSSLSGLPTTAATADSSFTLTISAVSASGDTLAYTQSGTDGKIPRDAAGNKLASVSGLTVGASITMNAVATDNIINATEDNSPVLIAGGSTDLITGTTITVTIDDADADTAADFTFTATTNATGAWTTASTDLTSARLLTLEEGALTITADDGASGAAAVSRTVTYDRTAPTATVSAVSGDNRVNSTESGSGVTVSGTTVGADTTGTTVDLTLTNGANTVTKSGLAVSANAWSASVTAAELTTLGDGTITASATATDAAGNAGTAGTRAITRDTALPTVTSASYNGSVITLAMSETVAVSGTKTGGDFTVSVTGATNPTVSSYSVSGSTVTLSLSSSIAADSVVSLAYALNAIAANRIKDVAGNEMAAVSTQSVVGKAITVSPVSDGFVNATEDDAALTVSGTSVNIADSTSVSVVVDGAGTDVTKTGTVSGNAWSVSLSASEVQGLDAETPHAVGETITITASADGVSGTATFIYDTVAPGAAVSAVATDNIVNATESGSAVTVSGTTTGADTTGTTVDLVLTRGSNTVTKSAVAVTSNAWSTTVTTAELTTLGDGTITASATATDAAGNAGTAGTRAITRDTALPTITSASYNGSTITLAMSETVSVSGTKTGGDFTVSVTGATDPTVSSYTITGTTVSLTLSSAIPSGSTVTLAYALNATAANRIKDVAGNDLAAVSTQSVVGKAVTVSPVSGGFVNATEDDSSLTISGTTVNIATGTSVAITVDGAGTDVTKNTVITGSNSAGAWTTSLTAAQVRALDAATPVATGETVTITASADGVSGTATFIYDTVAPGAAVSAVATDNIVNATESGSAVTVSGTTTGADTTGTTVDLVLTRGSNTVTKSAVAVTSNAWSTTVTTAELTTLGDGTITASATATDAAGNAGSAGTRAITRDTALPTITSASYNGSTITLAMSEAVSVSGTKTGADFTVSVTGATDPTVSSYTITGTTVSLTLSSAIAANSTVSLAYALNATAANRIKDVAGNDLAAVSTQSVVGKAVTVSPVSGGFVNATEDDSSLTISGTTVNIATGTAVAITVDGAGTDVTKNTVITGSNSAGAWTTSLTAAQVRALDAATPVATGETITVTATADGISGTATFIYDAVAPTTTVLPVSGGYISGSEDDGDVTIAAAADRDTAGVAFTVTDSTGTALTKTGTAGGFIGREKITSVGTHTLGASDFFGTAVALSGDTLAVGAYQDDDGADNAGAVYLLTDHDNDGDWTDTGTTVRKLHTTIGTHNLDAGDYFGTAVAISGITLAVSATGDDDGGSEAGAVYLLTDADNDGDWTDTGTTVRKLSTTIGTHTLDVYDYFGFAVAISGDTLAVGAYNDDDGNTSAGAVYLLTDHDDDGDWTDSGTVVNKLSTTIGTHTLGGSDFFGYAVAISGITLAVGAIGDDDGNTSAGAVYLLTDHDQDGDWTDSGTVVNKLSTTIGTHTLGGSDFFGYAVAISGITLAVGAIGDDDGNTSAGAVYLLTDHDQDGDWTDSGTTVNKLSTTIGSHTLDANDRFGEAVAFSGDTLAVGAINDDDVASNAGAVYTLAPSFTATLATGDFDKGTPAAGKLTEGALTVSAVPTDTAGNAGSAATGTTVYDQTVPTISAASYNGSTITLAMSETVAVAGGRVGADFTVTGGGAPTVSSYTVSGTVVTLTLSAAIPDGSTGVSLAYAKNAGAGSRITDTAGNELAAVSAQSVVGRAIVVPEISGGYLNGTEALSGLVISGTTINIPDGTALTVVFDGAGTDITRTGTVNGNAWTITVSAAQIAGLDASPSLPAGETITVRATAAGTVGTRSFIYDPTAPTVTVDAVSGDDLVNSTESAAGVSISGTTVGADSGTDVDLVLTGAGGATVTKNDLTVATNVWTAAITAAELTTLGDGTVSIRATADDTAGNTGSVSRTVTRDTVAPAAIVSGAPSGSSRVTVLAVTVSGADVTHYKHKTITGTTCPAGNYGAETAVATEITEDISALADGSVILCLIARDRAGNWQPESTATAVSWTKKTTAPTNATGTPTGPTKVRKGRSATFSGTTDSVPVTAGDYVAVEIGGTGSGQTGVSGDRYGRTDGFEADADGAVRWSVVVSGLPRGTHTLTVRYYNAADIMSTDSSPATHVITVRSSGGGSTGGGWRAPVIPGGADDDGSNTAGAPFVTNTIFKGTPPPVGYLGVSLTEEERAERARKHNKTIAEQIASLTVKMRTAVEANDKKERIRIANLLRPLINRINNPPTPDHGQMIQYIRRQITEVRALIKKRLEQKQQDTVSAPVGTGSVPLTGVRQQILRIREQIERIRDEIARRKQQTGTEQTALPDETEAPGEYTDHIDSIKDRIVRITQQLADPTLTPAERAALVSRLAALSDQLQSATR